jgi:hypothetical protein
MGARMRRLGPAVGCSRQPARGSCPDSQHARVRQCRRGLGDQPRALGVLPFAGVVTVACHAIATLGGTGACAGRFGEAQGSLAHAAAVGQQQGVEGLTANGFQFTRRAVHCARRGVLRRPPPALRSPDRRRDFR